MIKKLALPDMIRKNVFLFIGTFACFAFAFQIGMPLFSKAALEIAGKKEVVGLPLTLMSLAAILFSIPFGKLADKIGRKLAGIIGNLIIGCGCVVTAWGCSVSSWQIYLLGSTLIGVGLGAIIIYLLAVVDMFPPKRKGEATGFASLSVYLSQTVAPFVGGAIAASYGFNYAFLMGSVLAAFGAIILLFVRIEPLEIAAHMEKYYPDLEEVRPTREGKALKLRTIAQLLRLYPIQLQFWSRILIHSPKLFLIVLVPITLPELGYSMAWVGTLLMILGIGMFITSFPIGRLADKFGRKKIIFWGAVTSLLAIVGTVFTMNIVFLGIIFLITGIGFTAVNNAAPSIVADITHPMERGKTMALFGIGGSGGGVIFPILFSWIYGTFGIVYVGCVGAGLMMVIMLLLVPLRERAPGIYDNTGARPEDIPR